MCDIFTVEQLAVDSGNKEPQWKTCMLLLVNSGEGPGAGGGVHVGYVSRIRKDVKPGPSLLVSDMV